MIATSGNILTISLTEQGKAIDTASDTEQTDSNNDTEQQASDNDTDNDTDTASDKTTTSKRLMHIFDTNCTVCGAKRQVYHDVTGFNGQLKLGSDLNPFHCNGDKIHRTVNPDVLNSIHSKHKPDSKGTMYLTATK
jgi:hypothetical protein